MVVAESFNQHKTCKEKTVPKIYFKHGHYLLQLILIHLIYSF